VGKLVPLLSLPVSRYLRFVLRRRIVVEVVEGIVEGIVEDRRVIGLGEGIGTSLRARRQAVGQLVPLLAFTASRYLRCDRAMHSLRLSAFLVRGIVSFRGVVTHCWCFEEKTLGIRMEFGSFGFERGGCGCGWEEEGKGR
jgi:hypothetical protein